MSDSPVICFGQQPCGIFPRRFLFAKFQTARRLQSEIGGEIVFFYHDADHDPRETKSVVRHRKSGETLEMNFIYENKIQRKYSPLYLKRVTTEWREKTAIQIPAYADRRWVEVFKAMTATNVADFCLDMYRGMGLLDGIRVVRSSDPAFRAAACDIDDYFVDVSHQGETVRARRFEDGSLKLHEGGNSFVTLPACSYGKSQISPSRDSRLRWMQSVVRCTHYVCGAGEQAYLRKEDAPEITYVVRDTIDRADEAYTDVPE
jgi:hypothetical protein